MKIKYLISITTISLFAFLLYACGQRKSNQSTTSASEDKQNTTIVKLTPIVFGGNRYVVEADFGLEKKVPLMVHGNASFYLMLTHEIAEQLNNGNPIKKIRDYGYSDKGMGRMNVKEFKIQDRTFKNIENIPVFDWPKEEGKAAQGMLGIYFLKNERVRIDFVKEQMEIGVAINDQPDKSLLDQGYSYTKFFIENGEGYMNAYFDTLKKEIPITVGTVSDEYSLDLATFKSGVDVEIIDSKGHSPNNTTPQEYKNVSSIKYRIADKHFEIKKGKAEIYSLAEYENVKQSELFPFGIFGRDWMKENNVILDYANKYLYFKP